MEPTTWQGRLAGYTSATRPIRHAPAQKHLPVELITEIISYLTAPRDISSVLATSKQLRGIMLPKVYKDVSIHVNDNTMEKLAAFTACLDLPCAPRTSCGAQVESLTLCSSQGDVSHLFPPLYRLLMQLPNLTKLTLSLLCLNLNADAQLTPADIDLRAQLPEGAALLPAIVPGRSAERIDYCPPDPSPFPFGRDAFQGVCALRVSAEGLAMVDGLAGARPLTHSMVEGPLWPQVFVRGLPQALHNVTALTHHGLALADMFPQLERVDIEYYHDDDERDGDLVLLLAELRHEGKAGKGNLQRLRLLRLWGIVLTEEGRVWSVLRC
ncbi:hypothetical protein CCMSSC00406_0007081 [Pleurotus cornucopiae]|uniref:Uncharacterized protein n=1 Tax=Pleurotus cornucopiae TaxID=5321 RepID=A0ACB7J4Q4_PLECO|nr:hypothetical protein CCMSSC00406_0007081 [Pleurotus cornucopiae]